MRIPDPPGGGVSDLRQKNKVVIPVGLRPEKDCFGKPQQLLTTDSPSRHRGRPKSNPELSKGNKKKRNWPRVPGECLTPRQTGRHL
jgi:hypothetical protein